MDAATKELQRRQKALATESAKLAKAADVATVTLQRYQRAQRAAADAASAAVAAKSSAADATAAAADARTTLRSYAAALYRGGGMDPRILVMASSLAARGPQQFFERMALARQIGQRRSDMLTGLAAAQARQAAEASTALRAASLQQQAQARSRAASDEAGKAVAAYRAVVAARAGEVSTSAVVLEVARARQRQIDVAEGVARAGGWLPAPICAGGDVSGFANGELPPALLCPLLFAPGMRLRGDAAYAFNTMATEYAATFGTPLCVTDSYRSFGAQVTVAREKPDLAAQPGRSNHGWGLAVDLCGGIESFASPVHQWMLANSVLFGWFHPAWAEPTGTKPEAWHWEFAG